MSLGLKLAQLILAIRWDIYYTENYSVRCTKNLSKLNLYGHFFSLMRILGAVREREPGDVKSCGSVRQHYYELLRTRGTRGGPRAKINRCPPIDHAYFSFNLGMSLTTNTCIVSKKMGLYPVSCDTSRLNLDTPLRGTKRVRAVTWPWLHAIGNEGIKGVE